MQVTCIDAWTETRAVKRNWKWRLGPDPRARYWAREKTQNRYKKLSDRYAKRRSREYMYAKTRMIPQDRDTELCKSIYNIFYVVTSTDQNHRDGSNGSPQIAVARKWHLSIFQKVTCSQKGAWEKRERWRYFNVKYYTYMDVIGRLENKTCVTKRSYVFYVSFCSVYFTAQYQCLFMLFWLLVCNATVRHHCQK